MNLDTGEPQDTINPLVQQAIQEIGSHNTKISVIIAQEDPAVFTAIREGVSRVNKYATSQAHHVCNVQANTTNILFLL